jgi:hypothetical protein
MSFKNILKIAAVGALIYGAYKLGEKSGEKKYIDIEPIDEEKDFVDVVEESLDKGKSMFEEEIQYIKDLISNLQKKPNKSRGDRDTIELLKIKLEQLLKGK